MFSGRYLAILAFVYFYLSIKYYKFNVIRILFLEFYDLWVVFVGFVYDFLVIEGAIRPIMVIFIEVETINCHFYWDKKDIEIDRHSSELLINPCTH